MGSAQLTTRLLASLTALLVLAPPAAADTLDLLRASVRESPDDPELAWALALELSRRADTGAIPALRRFEVRWPGRRPEAALEIGRLLLEAGQAGEALRELERATKQSPRSGAAHLHAALAAQAAGRADAAVHHLERAGELAPELLGESRLLRATWDFERGEAEAAQQLVEQVLGDPATDPELASAGREMLGRFRHAAAPGRLRLHARAGAELDSNPRTRNGRGGPDVSSDARLLGEVGARLALLRDAASSLELGYRFSQSEHRELGDEDRRRHLVLASAVAGGDRRVSARVDAWSSFDVEDNERERWTAGVQPGLFAWLGPRAGWSHLFASFEHVAYFDAPRTRSRERGGQRLSVAAEQRVPLPFWEGAWSVPGLRLVRSRTRGERDAAGFGPAYDHDGVEASWWLRLPLPLGITADAFVGYARQRYVHRNVIDFDAGGPGRRRRDAHAHAGIGLVRSLTPAVEVELAGFGSWRHSNVDLFEYDRRVVGLYVRTGFD